MKISFKNTGHYFAVVAHSLIRAAQFLTSPQAKKVVNDLEPFAEAAEQIAGVPQPIVDVQRAALGTYGHVADALNAGVQRNPDGSLNVAPVAKEVVDAVESTMSTVNAFAAVQGIAKPLPQLPAPAAS